MSVETLQQIDDIRHTAIQYPCQASEWMATTQTLFSRKHCHRHWDLRVHYYWDLGVTPCGARLGIRKCETGAVHRPKIPVLIVHAPRRVVSDESDNCSLVTHTVAPK